MYQNQHHVIPTKNLSKWRSVHIEHSMALNVTEVISENRAHFRAHFRALSSTATRRLAACYPARNIPAALCVERRNTRRFVKLALHHHR